MVALDPFDVDGLRRAGPAGADAEGCAGGGSGAAARARPRAAGSGGGPHGPRGGVMMAGRHGPGRATGDPGARDCAAVRTGAGIATEDGRRAASMRRARAGWSVMNSNMAPALKIVAPGALAAPSRSRRPSASGVCPRRRRPASRRSNGAGRRVETLGLRWRFVRVQYSSHNTDCVPGPLLGRPVGHRRPGRRAEPVAPPQDRDRHRGRRSDRHQARGSRSSGTTPGSTSSSRASSADRRRSADPARVPAARRHG